MRQAFTLIELMIVIAIIAIIAAIAIPNLLESRVTSQESAAAAALKSGLLPAEVQFQNGGYSDADNNGIGTYCVTGASGTSATATPYNIMSGSSPIGGVTLNLLAPSYSGTIPSISGYLFKTPLADTNPTSTTDYSAERVWGVICYPADNNQGRRFFAINQAGNVYASKPSALASTGGADIGGSATVLSSTNLFGLSLVGSPVSTSYIPYRK